MSDSHYQNDAADETRIITQIDDYVATAPYANLWSTINNTFKTNRNGRLYF